MSTMTTDKIWARDLPKLTSTASSSSAGSTSTTSVSSSSRSTTSYSATVTPPSPSGNPNIWNPDHRPDGTVFIAVGSVVGAIIGALFLWWIITNFISRRIARKALYKSMDYQFREHVGSSLGYDYGDDKEMFLSLKEYPDSSEETAHKSKLSLLGNGVSSKSNLRDSTSWDSLPEYQPDIHNPIPVEKTNAIQDSFPNHYKRNSLFLSPTIEVLQQQQQQQQQHQQLLLPQQQKQQHQQPVGSRSRLRESGSHSKTLSSSSLTPSSDELNKPERAASPERKQKKTPGNGYHKRNNSSLGISPATSSVDQKNCDKTETRGNQEKGHRKQAPSMYLEDMLEGRNDLGKSD